MSLSLSDLDKEPAEQSQQTLDKKVDLPPATTEIKPGDGNAPSAADLEAARQKKEADDAAAALEAAKKPAGDAPAAEEPEEEGSVWDDVDALRGEPLEVEWKDDQGAIPEEERDTPRGILARERTLEARAVERFEQTLMKTDPRGYQYLLHREAGGTDEEFFAKKTITLPDYDRFKESVDLQVKVYADSLRNAGLSEKSIKHETDRAVKDKEIFELSDAAYNKQKTDEEKDIVRLNLQLENDRVQYERNVQGLKKAIETQIASKDMGIIVPDAKRIDFLNFVYQRVQRDEQTGAFLFAQVIDQKQLPRQLEALY